MAGATIALGLYSGRSGKDPREVANAVRPAAKALAQGFSARFGSLECRSLVAFDFSTPEGYETFRKSDSKQQRCHHYVAYAVRTVAEGQAAGNPLAPRS